uniref:Uncharacterized protein n=1 Tax=Arundo donax TaxID=35708 RepID=A0A0A9DFX5_ARUDO
MHVKVRYCLCLPYYILTMPIPTCLGLKGFVVVVLYSNNLILTMTGVCGS